MYLQNSNCEKIINNVDRINEEKQMESEVAFK